MRLEGEVQQLSAPRKNLHLHDRTLQSSGGEVPSGSLPWVIFSGTQSKEEFWGIVLSFIKSMHNDYKAE